MVSSLSDSRYLKLPADAEDLLRRASAPPRLLAHSILVHDVACRLIERITGAFSGVTFDAEAVSFGAAIHDFGKAGVKCELVGPGKEHERRGVQLLQQMGVSAHRARYAFTHGNWQTSNVSLEDLLVALADNCWKAKRVDELEMKVVEQLSLRSGEPAWTCFSKLDEILTSLSSDADSRLLWQAAFEPE